MDKLIGYHQAAVFIIHISTVGLVGLFVLMVTLVAQQLSKVGMHLRDMEFIVLIGTIQRKVRIIIGIALK